MFGRIETSLDASFSCIFIKYKLNYSCTRKVQYYLPIDEPIKRTEDRSLILKENSYMNINFTKKKIFIQEK